MVREKIKILISIMTVAAPSNSPIQVRFASVTSSSFSLYWDPPPYNDRNGIINYYLVRLLENETGILSVHTSNATFLHLSSLHPAYTYYCSIAAFTIALGPFSIEFNITMNEDGNTINVFICMFMVHF